MISIAAKRSLALQVIAICGPRHVYGTVSPVGGFEHDWPADQLPRAQMLALILLQAASVETELTLV